MPTQFDFPPCVRSCARFAAKFDWSAQHVANCRRMKYHTTPAAERERIYAALIRAKFMHEDDDGLCIAATHWTDRE